MVLPKLSQSYDDGLVWVYNSTLEPVNERRPEAPNDNISAPDKSNAGTNSIFTSDTPRRKTVYGIPGSTLILAIVLVILIIAASVAAGVGGSLAVKNAKQSCETSNTNNTTTNSSSVFKVETDVLLPLDCPGLDSTPQSSTFGHRTSVFQMYCHNTYAYSADTAILSIISYTLHDCLQACVSFNHYMGADNCTAATFHANLTLMIPNNQANCFMATNRDVFSLSPSSQGDYVVTGLLGPS
ncbi:hypothetical protein F5X98DRAFT_389657 [Xylaria grammica]|nr:hypothetical protein F5X98DRAFT_389657 [Xylaria grammica]